MEWSPQMEVLVSQSCPILWDPMDCNSSGSSVHSILQGSILEWVSIPFSRGSSWPRDQTWVSCTTSRFFTIWVTRDRSILLGVLFGQEVPWENEERGVKIVLKVKSESEVAQSCPTLCDPMCYSLSGSSVHGIFQARMLKWIAISFSRGSSWPRNQTQVSRIAGRCFKSSLMRVRNCFCNLFCTK